MTIDTHLLLRSAIVPVATLMRWLFIGYTVAFNRYHRRHGQLFQNRYKSILCQEDEYLLKLVRYIYLNSLRSGIVRSIQTPDSYPSTGHAALLGKHPAGWQDADIILRLFGSKKAAARRTYKAFIEKEVGQRRRPELVGGLIRSSGGWKQAKTLLKGMGRVKGDERILGDTDFVLTVLAHNEEKME